jgi:hypothetical protein
MLLGKIHNAITIVNATIIVVIVIIIPALHGGVS